MWIVPHMVHWYSPSASWAHKHSQRKYFCSAWATEEQNVCPCGVLAAFPLWRSSCCSCHWASSPTLAMKMNKHNLHETNSLCFRQRQSSSPWVSSIAMWSRGHCGQHSLLDSAKTLSLSLRRSAFSPSILALSSWMLLSSTLMALIWGVTSWWSPTLASSVFKSSIVHLVLLSRFCWSSASFCLRFSICLVSSICKGELIFIMKNIQLHIKATLYSDMDSLKDIRWDYTVLT